MEFLAGLIQAIAFFFGIYEENEVTRQQCAEMWSAGAVPYPLTDEQFDRIKKCKELEDDND